MKFRQLNKIIPIVLISFLMLLPIGCGKPIETSVSPTTLPTTAMGLTPTPTEIPASLLLVDAEAAADADTRASVQNFAAENGLAYQENVDLSGDLTAVRLAVVFGDAANFNNQAAANSGTQFIFVGATNASAAGNISLVKNQPQDLAFMAGYLATIVAEDWRSGGLLSSNTLPVETISNAFYNGGKYLCAYCLPVYPPYPQDIPLYPPYSPLYLDVSGKTGSGMTTDVYTLAQYSVDTLFVSTAADLPEVLDAADGEGMFLIGENTTSANLARYAAILGYDDKSALEALLPAVLAGEGGQTVVAQVVLAVVNNSQKVTPGKQEQFNTAAESLAGGWIIPLSVQ